MKRLRLVKNILFGLLLGAVGLYLAAYFLWPQTVERYLPYRFYTVLTDSMAPYMPPMSLVLVRQIPADVPLELAPEQIVTFRADRFGQKITRPTAFPIPNGTGSWARPSTAPIRRALRSGFLQDHPAGHSGRVCVPSAVSGQGDAVSAKPVGSDPAGGAAGHLSGQSAHPGPLGGAGAAGTKTGAAPANGRKLAFSPPCPGRAGSRPLALHRTPG